MASMFFRLGLLGTFVLSTTTVCSWISPTEISPETSQGSSDTLFSLGVLAHALVLIGLVIRYRRSKIWRAFARTLINVATTNVALSLLWCANYCLRQVLRPQWDLYDILNWVLTDWNVAWRQFRIPICIAFLLFLMATRFSVTPFFDWDTRPPSRLSLWQLIRIARTLLFDPLNVPSLDLEENLEMFIERFTLPNLWLTPAIPNDYVSYLPVWSHNVTAAPAGMQAATECAICLEKYQNATQVCGLPCGHNFDHECILRWLQRDHHHCPICRWPTYKLNSSVKTWA